MSKGFRPLATTGATKKNLTVTNNQVWRSFLFSDKSTSSTTPSEATSMSLSLPVGTYAFQYYLRYQAAATTTGIRFSVNFTGTVTAFVANLHFCDTQATGATAAATQAGAGGAGQVFTVMAARAKSTAGWGTSVSVDAANSDLMIRIDGVMVVTVAGDIELYHGSEVAAATTLKAGSSLVVWKTG